MDIIPQIDDDMTETAKTKARVYRDFYARRRDMSTSQRFHIYCSICADRSDLRYARPLIRRGDESPDGDWALPWPRRASASPGVASATPPTLRVSSPRRTRMPPTRHTNFHEWNHKARCFIESAAHLVVDFIDCSANCVAFVWVCQSLVHKMTIMANSCPKFV